MKQIAKQLALRFSGLYSAATVFYSFCILWMVTFLRALLDRFQWGLRRHYILKRVLFAPLYLNITLLTLINFGYPFENSWNDVFFIAVIFALGFVISLFLALPYAKKQEKQFDQILRKY